MLRLNLNPLCQHHFNKMCPICLCYLEFIWYINCWLWISWRINDLDSKFTSAEIMPASLWPWMIFSIHQDCVGTDFCCWVVTAITVMGILETPETWGASLPLLDQYSDAAAVTRAVIGESNSTLNTASSTSTLLASRKLTQNSSLRWIENEMRWGGLGIHEA